MAEADENSVFAHGKGRKVRHLQAESDLTEVIALVGSLSKSKGKRSWQAWHYLIPILIVFWLAFAAFVVITNYLPFLVIGVMAILALFSVLIIGLAWAYQNNI
jgi:apolipoprotein N-acyltransferase